MCCAVKKVQLKLQCVLVGKAIFFSSCLLSHQSHGAAHREDGRSRSRRRPRDNALLLQGQDGQPCSDPALHKGQVTAQRHTHICT